MYITKIDKSLGVRIFSIIEIIVNENIIIKIGQHY